MEENEKKVQEALGTRKRYQFVSADWKDIDGLADDFIAACRHFGLYVYADPAYEGTDAYGYIVSEKELTDKQVREICCPERECGDNLSE